MFNPTQDPVTPARSSHHKKRFRLVNRLTRLCGNIFNSLGPSEFHSCPGPNTTFHVAQAWSRCYTFLAKAANAAPETVERLEMRRINDAITYDQVFELGRNTLWGIGRSAQG